MIEIRLGDLLSTIFNPTKIFEKVNSERPVLFDSLLMFTFIHILLLGVSYLVLSLSTRYYGLEQYLSILLGVPAVLFLRNPGAGSLFLSLVFGIIDILVLTGIISIITEKIGRRGHFSSLVMMFSLVQVISIVAAIAILPLQSVLKYGSPIMLPLFSTVFGIYIWKLMLYFIGIRTIYRFDSEKTFLILIISFILYSMAASYIFSSVYRGSPIIQPLVDVGRIKGLESISSIG